MTRVSCSTCKRKRFQIVGVREWAVVVGVALMVFSTVGWMIGGMVVQTDMRRACPEVVSPNRPCQDFFQQSNDFFVTCPHPDQKLEVTKDILDPGGGPRLYGTVVCRCPRK
jgi:hypothetical protein